MTDPITPPTFHRPLTPDEEFVVWACLWANVRYVHQPVYNLDAAHLALGVALFNELDARYMADPGATGADERELLHALMHGVLEEEFDAQVADGERADQLCEHYDRLINERAAAAS